MAIGCAVEIEFLLGILRTYIGVIAKLFQLDFVDLFLHLLVVFIL